MRPAGDVLFVDLVVAVSRTLPLDRVAALKERIESAVRKEFPKAEVTVTTEPRALDDESVLERVMVIARNRALAVHHVTVHAIEGTACRRARPRGGRQRCRSAPRTRSRAGSKHAIREELGTGGRGRDAHRAAAAAR